MKKTPTARLLLPEGVSAGAAIGAGGRNVRAIGTRHNVRCLVNPPQREIEFLGHQENVANAIADFQEVFAHILATCAEAEKPAPVNAAGDNFIHLRAMAKTHDAWTFEQRDKIAVKVDVHTKHYEYRLVPSSEPASFGMNKTVEAPWLHEFNDSFRDRMIDDVLALHVEKPDRDIRLKAALGLTCFALRDAGLVSKTLLWTDLLALQPVDQIQSRWSSAWDASSSPVTTLLTRLLEVAKKQQTPIKTTMTVYVGTMNAKNVEDVVVKYRYEDDKWVPLASLRPRRVLLAQYDIGTSNTDLGFRVRAYAREASEPTPENASIADHLEMVRPSFGSHFLTTAVARSTMPTNRFVRGCTVKEKLGIDWQGLHFTVSYMNKRRTRVRIECGVLDTKVHANDQKNQDRLLAEAMETLTAKVLDLTKLSAPA